MFDRVSYRQLIKVRLCITWDDTLPREIRLPGAIPLFAAAVNSIDDAAAT
ncbi:MAG: hypothetical protein ABI552_13115 [Casimicrobiaceae bacterium]